MSQFKLKFMGSGSSGMTEPQQLAKVHSRNIENYEIDCKEGVPNTPFCSKAKMFEKASKKDSTTSEYQASTKKPSSASDSYEANVFPNLQGCQDQSPNCQSLASPPARHSLTTNLNKMIGDEDNLFLPGKSRRQQLPLVFEGNLAGQQKQEPSIRRSRTIHEIINEQLEDRTKYQIIGGFAMRKAYKFPPDTKPE